MTIYQLNRNINTGLTYNNFTKEMFRWIKANLKNVLLEMNKKQLFLLSEGKDGVALGVYHRQSENYRVNKGASNLIGEPYDMVFTGKLKNNMKVIVTLNSITFKSDDAHVEDLQQHDFWWTKNWFGLNEKNMDQFINHYLIKVARDINLRKIRTGKWGTV